MANKEAIERLGWIKEIMCEITSSPECFEALNLAIKALEERPQGRWIRYRDNPHQPEHIKCSNCGQYWSIADHDKIFDICFKCGADMREGDTE